MPVSSDGLVCYRFLTPASQPRPKHVPSRGVTLARHSEGGGSHPGLPRPRRYRLPSISVDRRRKVLPTFWARLSVRLQPVTCPTTVRFQAASVTFSRVVCPYPGARRYVPKTFVHLGPTVASTRDRPWHRPALGSEFLLSARLAMPRILNPGPLLLRSVGAMAAAHWAIYVVHFCPLLNAPPATVTVGRFNFTADEINGRFQRRLLEGGRHRGSWPPPKTFYSLFCWIFSLTQYVRH